MLTKKCAMCKENIPVDKQNQILRHSFLGRNHECLGSNSHVTEWASEEDRLKVESATKS